MNAPKENFSFAAYAPEFDTHIRNSIPAYDGLSSACKVESLRFVQAGTTVLDVGCSSGRLLAEIRDENQTARPDVKYVGIDCESRFREQWDSLSSTNISFEVCDARTYAYENASFVMSRFTVQFMRPMDKLPLLKRIYDGLVAGGALLIAEKTLAETARLQDALTFHYYDYKREMGFSPEHILDKERSLRGQMTLWTETELLAVLSQVGFREINPIWRSLLFAGYLALK